MEINITKLQSMATLGIHEGEKITKFIRSEYEQLANEELNYVKIAQKLGIYFEKRIYRNNIEQEVQQICESIKKMQEDMEVLKDVPEEEITRENEVIKNNEDHEDNTENEANHKNITKEVEKVLPEKEIIDRQVKIKAMSDKISLCNEISKELPNIRKMYKEKAMNEIRKSLYVKVQTLIRDEKLNKLYTQKEEMENSKTTILEKVFGREKLKNEQIRFVELQIRSLIEQQIQPKEKYSIKDSLAQITAFALLNEQTKQMKELENNIYESFEGFTRKDIEEMAIIKNSQRAELPIQTQEKISIFQLRKQAKELSQKNDRIESEIQENIINSSRSTKVHEVEEQDNIIVFSNKLQIMAGIVTTNAPTQ